MLIRPKKERVEKTIVAEVAIRKFKAKSRNSIPGVSYGSLHYREMEMNKIACLILKKGNFEAPVSLFNKALSEMSWWEENLQGVTK